MEIKYCPYCGATLPADAKFCIGCGRQQTTEHVVAVEAPTRHRMTGLQVATLIVQLLYIGAWLVPSMIYAIIWPLGFLLFIPFLVPAGISIATLVAWYNRIRQGKSIELSFRILVILFVNLIAGIMMCFDKQ